jgi:hypothetical protein
MAVQQCLRCGTPRSQGWLAGTDFCSESCLRIYEEDVAEAEPKSLDDIFIDVAASHYVATEQGANSINGRLFGEELLNQAFRFAAVDDVAGRAGDRDPFPEINPRYRSILQEKIRTAIRHATAVWWDDELREARADSAGRAVADKVEPYIEAAARRIARLGPQSKPPVLPPEIQAAYDAERRYRGY